MLAVQVARWSLETMLVGREEGGGVNRRWETYEAGVLEALSDFCGERRGDLEVRCAGGRFVVEGWFGGHDCEV